MDPNRPSGAENYRTGASPSGDGPASPRPADGGSALGAFGLGQDNATSKWMKMISSTLLGETSGSLFSRWTPAADAGSGLSATSPRKSMGKNDGDMTELKIALVGGPGVVRLG